MCMPLLRASVGMVAYIWSCVQFNLIHIRLSMCATVLMVVPVYPVSVVTSPLLFMGAVRPIVFQKKKKKNPANALFDIRVCHFILPMALYILPNVLTVY